jgi:hypothetical protein
MKPNIATLEDIRVRMGCDATTQEAETMLQILQNHGIEDTNTVPDGQWFAWVGKCVQPDKTMTLGDGVVIKVKGRLDVAKTFTGYLLSSAEVYQGNTIVHFVTSPDGKTVSLDDDNMAEVAAIFGVTEDELRSNLWP